jgi:alginate O-acetyltransferase complex protein AlgI
MSFNSLLFLPFILILFWMYWYLFRSKTQKQNALLLIASVIFIGYNDWQALCVISVTGILNYFLVQRMNAMSEGNQKKWFFYAGVALNIGVLSYFKYLEDLWHGLTMMLNGAPSTLSTLALPLGLSFFTFQLIAYWIDIYNEEIEPETNLLDFGVYLFYFPKVVSGPIELAQNFLPQMKTMRTFDVPLFTDGLRQFLWGFFKKTVVSMHCLAFFNLLKGSESLSGADVVLTGILNILYIYADFSGYSDMACGVSKLFGIRITNNFAFPFYSTTISEFWKKWHISLTSWVVKYVFTPLSFILRKSKKWGIAISIIASFLVVGIWHGLKMNYIIFGVLHGLFFIPLILKGGGFNSTNQSKTIWRPLQMVGLFLLVSITSLFFRQIEVAESWNQVLSIFSPTVLHPNSEIFGGFTYQVYWVLIFVMLTVEYLHRNKEHGLDIRYLPTYLRWGAYYFVILAIFFFGVYSSNSFVYVQF